MVFTYHDVAEWWDDVVSHDCGVDKLLLFDDPKNLMMGYGCRECDDVFRIGANHVKSTSCPVELREGLRTPESRVALPLLWMSGVLIVLEERV